jgi:hypothetical protein
MRKIIVFLFLVLSCLMSAQSAEAVASQNGVLIFISE